MLRLVLSLLPVFHPSCTVSQKGNRRLNHCYRAAGHWVLRYLQKDFPLWAWQFWLQRGQELEVDGDWKPEPSWWTLREFWLSDIPADNFTGVSSEHHNSLLLWDRGAPEVGPKQAGQGGTVHCALVTSQLAAIGRAWTAGLPQQGMGIQSQWETGAHLKQAWGTSASPQHSSSHC